MKAVPGIMYDGDDRLRQEAANLFDALNHGSGIWQGEKERSAPSGVTSVLDRISTTPAGPSSRGRFFASASGAIARRTASGSRATGTGNRRTLVASGADDKLRRPPVPGNTLPRAS